MDNDTNLPVKGNAVPKSTLQNAQNILNGRSLALSQTQYSSKATRENPCSFVFLIDQSGSMGEVITHANGLNRSKAEAVSEIVNEFITLITMKCYRDNTIKDYFDLLIIGYGNPDENENEVNIAWENQLKGKTWLCASELVNNPIENKLVEFETTLPWGEIKTIKQSIKSWIKPYAKSLTPMYEALSLCKDYVEEWVLKNENSFPTMIFNITDGIPTDIDSTEELVKVCDEIKELKTNDGNCLLINCLLPDQIGKEIILPDIDQEINFDDAFQEALFLSSSLLPAELKGLASEIFRASLPINSDVRMTIVNSKPDSLIKLVNFGSRTSL